MTPDHDIEQLRRALDRADAAQLIEDQAEVHVIVARYGDTVIAVKGPYANQPMAMLAAAEWWLDTDDDVGLSLHRLYPPD